MVRPAVADGRSTAPGTQPGRPLLAEAADHQQRVVDGEAEPEQVVTGTVFGSRVMKREASRQQERAADRGDRADSGSRAASSPPKTAPSPPG